MSLLPPTQVTKPKRRRRNFRPINPTDTAATTGLAVNPIGAMIPSNPSPGTQAYGPQGTFGANLPVAVQPVANAFSQGGNVLRDAYSLFQNPGRQTWTQQAASMGAPSGTGSFIAGGGTQFAGPITPAPAGNGMYVGQGVRVPTGTPSPTGTQIPTTRFGNYHGQQGFSASTTQIIAQIQADPASFASLPPATREAIDNLLIAGQQRQGSITNAAGTGSAEFMNTRFMQENAAKGTDFTKQLRWDPDRKKFVQIGKLISEGRLDVRDRNARLRRRRRGGGDGGGRGQQQAAAAPQQTTSGFTGSYGVVNFNTGTG